MPHFSTPDTGRELGGGEAKKEGRQPSAVMRSDGRETCVDRMGSVPPMRARRPIYKQFNVGIQSFLRLRGVAVPLKVRVRNARNLSAIKPRTPAPEAPLAAIRAALVIHMGHIVDSCIYKLSIRRQTRMAMCVR
jgi:hypothetical protein